MPSPLKPRIYLVQRHNFEQHTDRKGRRQKPLACFTTASQANKRAREEVDKVHAKSNKSVSSKLEDCSKGDCFAAEIILNENFPGSWMAVVEVLKMS
jgi:hypothetical protein